VMCAAEMKSMMNLGQYCKIMIGSPPVIPGPGLHRDRSTPQAPKTTKQHLSMNIYVHECT